MTLNVMPFAVSRVRVVCLYGQASLYVDSFPFLPSFFPLYHNEPLRFSFLDRDTNVMLTDTCNALHLLIFSFSFGSQRGNPEDAVA